MVWVLLALTIVSANVYDPGLPSYIKIVLETRNKFLG